MLIAKVPILSKVLKSLFSMSGVITKSFSSLAGVLKIGVGALSGIAIAIGVVIGALVYMWNTNEDFRNNMTEIWNKISASVGSALDRIGQLLMSIWKNALKPFMSFVSQTFAPIIEYAFEAIGDTVETLLGILTGILEFVLGVFTLNWSQAWDGIKTIFQSVFDFIGSIAKTAFDLILSTWEPIANWFNDNVVQPIMNFFSPLINWFGQLFDSIFETISSTFTVIGQIAQGCWSVITSCWNIASSWFDNTVVTPIKSIFDGAWNSLTRGASNAWNGIKSIFGNVASFFRNTFSGAWTAVKNVFSTGGKIFDGIKDGIVSAFKKIVNGIINGINKVVATPFNGINNALRSIRNVDILGYKPFKGLGSISVPRIPLFANGGFPDVGEMFIAREKGPELVGRMGTRNAVANNTQIENGIYKAVMSAIRDAGGMVQKGQGGDLHIIIQDEDGRTKIEKIIKNYNDYIRSTGGEGGFAV